MIQVGQKLVCINTIPHSNSDHVVVQYLSLLKKGQTYTVRGVHEIKGVVALLLDEIQTPFSNRIGRELGYNSDRFRPLTDSDLWADEILSQIVEEIEDEFLVKK